MSKKTKRYDGEDGSVVETDTAQGKNEMIKDDTRAKAMAMIANRDNAPAPTPAKKEVGKAIAKAASEEKAEPAKPSAADKLRSDLNISKPSMPKMMRGKTDTGVNLKDALFGGSSGSQRSKAAQRSRAMDASNYSMKSGGKVGSASKRADGIAQKGKTRGKMC
jgi:hypothetical protein